MEVTCCNKYSVSIIATHRTKGTPTLKQKSTPFNTDHTPA